jgi:3-carboxy-cis,cis-muconate cycloisomerase
MTESVSMALAPEIGRSEAKDLVAAAAGRAGESGRPLRDELLADPQINAHLSPEQIDQALDPDAYLGSASDFVDRALAAWGESQ